MFLIINFRHCPEEWLPYGVFILSIVRSPHKSREACVCVMARETERDQLGRNKMDLVSLL